jgi:hypothetical protein
MRNEIRHKSMMILLPLVFCSLGPERSVVEGPAVRLYRPEICGRDERTGGYFALIALRICASASSLQYLQLSCRKTEV